MKRKNKPELAIEHARELAGKVEWEGDLLYVVRNWEFKEFRDKKFTSLAKALRKAAQDLETYCHLERVEEEEEEQAATEDGHCHTCLKLPEDCVCEEGVTCERCGDALDENGQCGTCGD